MSVSDLPPPSLPPERRSLNTSVALALSFAAVAVVFLPLWQPLLLGGVFAAAVSRWHDRLAHRLRERRFLSAGIFTFLVVILILAPTIILSIIAVKQASRGITWISDVLRDGNLSRVLEPLPDNLARAIEPLLKRVPRSLSKLPEGSVEATTWAATQLQGLLGAVSDIAFEIAMMIIAFYFLLTDGNKFAAWCKSVSPLGRSRTQEVFDEFRLVSRSLIGTNLITGGAQAVVATIGYMLSGAPSPLFFGTLTFLTSFIPSVGTAIVFLPLAGLLALVGKSWAALFLAAWGIVFVGFVDNLLRPLLMKGGVQVHGALLFFALIGGILLFGLAGLIVGPMVLSLFLTLMRFHNRDLRVELASSSPPPPPPPATAR